MKTFTIVPLLLFVLMVVAHSAIADDAKYVEAMKKNIDVLYAAKSIPELQSSVNTLERIGGAEKSKWEPFYYAAFGYILMADKETDAAKKDNYLDLALKSVEKAKSINDKESEIVAMEGFALMIRVTVDPPTRGPQFAPMAMQTFGKAIGMNGENPRARALLAQMQFGTAQFFGSSTAEACSMASSALEKYDTFKSDNPLAPVWGREMTEGLKKKCN